MRFSFLAVAVLLCATLLANNVLALSWSGGAGGGSGTLTSLTRGHGLNLSGTDITSTGSIDVNFSIAQYRVSGICSGSNALQVINADGSVTCVATSANASFNQSLTDVLYAAKIWGYNQTYSGSTFNSTYAAALNATFNQTLTDSLYAAKIWGYNQTYSGSTFNATYAANQANNTFNQSLTDSLYAGKRWDYNQTQNVTRGFGMNLTGTPLGMGGTLDVNLSVVKTYADTLYAGVQFGYNQTTPAQAYADTIVNRTFNQTLTDSLYAPKKWDYNQTTLSRAYTDAQINANNSAFTTTFNTTYDNLNRNVTNVTCASGQFFNGTLVNGKPTCAAPSGSGNISGDGTTGWLSYFTGQNTLSGNTNFRINATNASLELWNSTCIYFPNTQASTERSVYICPNSIGDLEIGATSAGTITFLADALSFAGTLQTQSLSLSQYVESDLTPSTANTKNLGSSALQWFRAFVGELRAQNVSAVTINATTVNATNFIGEGSRITNLSARWTMQASASSASLSNATTIFIGSNYATAPGQTGGRQRIYIPANGTLRSIFLFIDITGATSNSINATGYFRLNSTTDYLFHSNITYNSTTQVFSNQSLNVPVVAGDFFEVRIVEPPWAVLPTNVRHHASLYFE